MVIRSLKRLLVLDFEGTKKNIKNSETFFKFLRITYVYSIRVKNSPIIYTHKKEIGFKLVQIFETFFTRT